MGESMKKSMMSLSEVVRTLGARRIGPDREFDAVSTDSRKIGAGELFIALRGENFDGYEFVAGAFEAGAVAVMVNADSYQAHPLVPPSAGTLLVVEDTRLALGQLAAHWRSKFAIPLAAITGSNGKTTVKEMLAAILRDAAGGAAAVLATRGNLNNDIGLPLTLLGLRPQHRYAVVEMGMNHPGEIDYLTRIAHPDVALINNASGAHLEGLGSVEAVAQAKGEIFAGLGDHGTAVINEDDPYASLWRSLAGTSQLLEFGLCTDAEVSGRWQPHGNGLNLDVQSPLGHFAVELQVPGEHNARNALAAIAAAIALNVPQSSIVAGLSGFGGVAGRLQRKAGRNGAMLIDDTYNANPASMRAAIGVLAQQPGRRIFVLGDMGELGENAATFHDELGVEARRAGIDSLYALGRFSRGAVDAFGAGAVHFERIEDLYAALDRQLAADVTVLVKGSRFMKMERVVQHCIAEEETACCSH